MGFTFQQLLQGVDLIVVVLGCIVGAEQLPCLPLVVNMCFTYEHFGAGHLSRGILGLNKKCSVEV